MEKGPLSAVQSHALLDILSHHQVYQEIRNFREPGILERYGPPFKHNSDVPSATPILQVLLSKFVLTLPGLRDVSKDFWQERCHVIIENFEKAELSESYDRGTLGIRKTLTTAISALIEYPGRALFTGLRKSSNVTEKYDYDTSNPEDLSKAFQDFLHQMVYGDVLEQMIKRIEETDNLSDHSPLVQASHEYVLLNLASLLHFTLILSPKGQYLLSLVESANKLIPYAIIKQTLKIGNVASMINAMMKVVLAKMSVGSVTNWMGWTQSADEGMNLMQHIISTVLHWDIKDLKSRALKIEKDREGLDKSQLQTLQGYPAKSPGEHERIRNLSMTESKSIISVIFSDSGISTDISEDQHKAALEYLSIQLSIRDRLEIINVLCHSKPDHLTTATKDIVAAYEPIIRSVHNAVDLSDTVTDFENFLRDLLHISKVSSKGTGHTGSAPTVGDFVLLLRKHQYSCHKFLHQCVKNGKEVTGWFQDWAQKAASQFHRELEGNKVEGEEKPYSDGAGMLTDDLIKIFDSISTEQQDVIAPILEKHAAYLSKLHDASAARLTSVVDSPPSDHSIFKSTHFPSHLQGLGHSRSRPNSTSASRSGSRHGSPARSTPTESMPEADPGPGAFLARWQALLDDTPITPNSPNGPVRYGKSREGRLSKNPTSSDSAKNENGKQHITPMTTGEIAQLGMEKDQRPNVDQLIEELLPAFKQLLAKRACDW